MFTTFVGLGRFINCQRPDYTISSPKSEVRCPVHRQKKGRHLLPPADDVPEV